MKVVIVIDGNSAEDLFAVGPKDIVDILKVDIKDVKTLRFEEYDKEAFKRGEVYEVVTHKDNIERRN